MQVLCKSKGIVFQFPRQLRDACAGKVADCLLLFTFLSAVDEQQHENEEHEQATKTEKYLIHSKKSLRRTHAVETRSSDCERFA